MNKKEEEEKKEKLYNFPFKMLVFFLIFIKKR